MSIELTDKILSDSYKVSFISPRKNASSDDDYEGVFNNYKLPEVMEMSLPTLQATFANDVSTGVLDCYGNNRW